eukprot:scaffold470827_cov20-Prasinocladus_malaysianus.AAC.1
MSIYACLHSSSYYYQGRSGQVASTGAAGPAILVSVFGPGWPSGSGESTALVLPLHLDAYRTTVRGRASETDAGSAA